MKKHLIVSAVVLFLFAAPHTFAQFVPLVPGGIPGLTDLQPAKEDTLVTFFNNLYKYLIGVAAALAVIMIIWGGLLYSTTDSVGNKEEGKKKIRMALFGLVLVLAPVLVFSVINPSILNLSIGLKPINLSVPTSSTTPRGPNVPSTVGTGNPCGTGGDVTGSGRCTTTIFDEGDYVTPPPGAYCYVQKNPVGGRTYMCFRSAESCDAARRTSCGTAAEQIGCPADQAVRNPCTRAPS